jgi:hypothetical protein
MTTPVLLAVSVAAAQEQWDRFRGGYGRNRYPPRFPTATSGDGGFNFCRLIHERSPQAGGSGGRPTTDADINFRCSAS